MMKRISAKPTYNTIGILFLTVLVISIIFLSQDITPASQRVEKSIDITNAIKN